AFAPGAAMAQDTTAASQDACANAGDEAARQACADAIEQQDATATSGDAATAATQSSAEATQADSSETIVVTGSRLRRDERNSPDPVTIIDPSLSEKEGLFQTAEALQTSPLAAGSTQITSTISTNFVVNGGEGAQTINLRGLGANRTLVLLNGRRAGPAGVRGGVSAFDLNVIPLDAIQTIDVLKTGASSIYGSDAIAGVVNLITKKDLRGLDVSGFVSIPQDGGGEQYSVSATYGGSIGDRGHYLIGANWYHHKELERRDRDFLGCPEEYVFSEATGERADPIDPRTGQAYCGDFLSNMAILSDFGLMISSNLRGPLLPDNTPPDGSTTSRRAITGLQFDPSLGSILGPDQTGLFFLTNPANSTQFRAPAGWFPVGAHEATSLAVQNNHDPRADNDSVIPDTKRFTLFAEAGYELTDRVDLYVEGLYNRRKTKTDASRQLFFNQFPGTSETIFTVIYGDAVNRPYQMPYFFCDGTTCDPNASGDPLNTEFSGAALIQPVIWAPFDSGTDVKYYRGVAGIRANLDNVLPNGFLDFHVQHSRSDGDYKRTVIFRDAIEFGVAELRTELCEGTLTAIRGVPCMDIDYLDPRVLAGNFTAAEQAFLFGVDKGNTLYKQTSAEVTVGGDVFELPAGPVKVALGLHARRDYINDLPGEIGLEGNLWGSTSSGQTKGYQRTREAFGEIEIPILEDAPFARSLTFSGAARLTNTYAKRTGPVCSAPGDCVFDGASDSDKGNWTYKLAGNWQVTDWLRFRATYGTSFRSPALFEQFLANESGFLSQANDPCVRWGESENDEIRANCAAQGIPDDHVGGGSFETFSQGGIGLLDPETSRAWTASVIFTPQSWLWEGAKFSFTADYVDIKVKDQVTQLGAGTILAACYTSDTFPDDPLCDLFTRNPEGAPSEFDIDVVNDPFLNIDTQHNKSIDFTTRFRQDLGNMGTLSILGQLTYQLKDKYTLFQGTEQNFNGEVGDPKWIGDVDITWTKAPFTITYGLQVISKTNDLDDLEDIGGTSFTEGNCLATAAAFALRNGPYCPVYKLPRVAYHSISAEIEAAKGFSFLFGVSNLFDKKPPLVSTVGTPIGSFAQVPLLGSYYDYYGRRFFVSAKTHF
ncbi:MAG TPA: TonB-dependent receptor, partial [Sphingomicrobium sp.]|nr:TonB-dependent receptor [Sphingomicrobium sp.]